MKAIISSFSYKEKILKKKKKSKLDKHILFSWKTTTKRAELAGELTELFHTSVKMGCWNPWMAKDVECGPRCPCCPLEHPSTVLARVIWVIWVVFCLVGAASPQIQVVDAGAFHKASLAFPGSGVGGGRRAETRLPTGPGCFQNVPLKMETSHPEHPRAHFSVLPSSKMGGERG